MENITLTVQKSVYGEYRVAVYVNGKYSEELTYYTDDIEDAARSRKAMREHYEKQGHAVTNTAYVRRGMDF